MKRSPAITLVALSLSATLGGAVAPPRAGVAAAAADERSPAAVATAAPYAPRSDFLRDPDEAKDFVRRSADFWVAHAFDPVHGGTFADLDRLGQPTRPDRRKSSMHQSRNAYAMTRAYMLTGDEKYLAYARSALDFLYRHGWDREHGGWLAVHNPDGGLAAHDLNLRKDAFYQHYALLGIAAAVEAEGRGRDRAWLRRGYRSLERGLWDRREGREGYYATAARDWTQRSGKSFNATVDALTTHVLALHNLTGDPAYEERAVELAEQVLTHLVGSMDDPGVAFGFPQDYDQAWNVLSAEDSQQRVYVGHVLKTAWVLLRVNEVRPDPRYVDAARELIQEVWTHDPDTPPGRPDEASYDRRHGGVMSNYYWTTGRLRVTPTQPPQKLWWEQEQAFMAGLLHWHATGDQTSLRIADESIDFFARHFEDRVSGEVFETLRPDGTVLVDRKASLNKAGYHSAETGYLAYLYGSLFYHRRPVTLHYRFPASDAVRRIRLTPLEVDEDRLRIRSVTLDGKPFCTVKRRQRTLVLPAGTGGEFAVQFEVARSRGASPGDPACRASR